MYISHGPYDFRTRQSLWRSRPGNPEAGMVQGEGGGLVHGPDSMVEPGTLSELAEGLVVMGIEPRTTGESRWTKCRQYIMPGSDGGVSPWTPGARRSSGPRKGVMLRFL